MLRDKKAVIFDMDGSLVDSMWIWPEVDRIYMEKYHLTPTDTFHKHINGRSYTERAKCNVATCPSCECTTAPLMDWGRARRDRY